MNYFSLLVLLFSISQLSNAKDIVLGAHRIDNKPYLKAANVWNLPPWMNNQLKFVANPDIINGPEAKGYAKNFVNKSTGYNEVFCQTNEEDQERGFGGKTPKLYCQLLEVKGAGLQPVFEDDGDRRVIKAKYHPAGELNNEIYGEILGTRLLWVLGFGADQMFYVDKINCFGCSLDPFKDRIVDPTTLKYPQIFQGVAIERKIKGDELLSAIMVPKGNSQWEKDFQEGVGFREMMENLPDKSKYPKARAIQLARRDALRLLAVFMQHTDLKKDNQRFICLSKNNKTKCDKPFILIHDIGTSFGVRLKGLKLDKVHLDTWRNTPIWSNPHNCEAQMSTNLAFNLQIRGEDNSMVRPKISEAGRKFLAALLGNFAADRNRVRDLFRAAHIDERGRGESIEDWVDVFIDKVRQIQNPVLGSANFECPPSPYE